MAKGTAGASGTAGRSATAAVPATEGFEEQGTDWGLAQHEAAPDLNIQQETALRFYTGNGYSYFNSPLREGYLATEPFEKRSRVAMIQQSLLAAQTTENTLLYRVFDDTAFVEGLVVGGTFGDRGFVSTSVSRSGVGFFAPSAFDPSWGGHARMEIELPKGSPGRYLNVEPKHLSSSRISQNRDEDEFLLPHGSQFQIISKHMDGKKPVVRLRFIGVEGG